MAKFMSSKFSIWLPVFTNRFLNFLFYSWRLQARVDAASSLEEARVRLERISYSSDRIKLLGIKTNRIKPAEFIQDRINRGLDPRGDCDEFALYACAMLDGMPRVSNPLMMTLRYEREDGSVGGHNTCIFTYIDSGGFRYGTLCNWGLKLGFKTRKEAAKSFTRLDNKKLLSLGVSTKELRFIDYEKCQEKA